ncbi:MAG: DUF4924 family protein [Bacteroidaceae bacterium]|nr:DUF4924 family protein [Bacteroidaceae bacterium]
MFIANQLKTTNRAELLLYLWQVEDILRAYDCDIDKLKQGYLTRFSLEAEQQAQLEQWYADLCTMMLEEGVRQQGHLQICKNVLIGMEDLHVQLLQSAKFPYYKEMYYRVLPFIVELRKKGADTTESELHVCFNALYGYMMLRLKNQPISDDTRAAIKHISTLLGQLSDYYLKDKQEPLEFD